MYEQKVTIENEYEPTVSVIVPVMNAESTIKDLLDSLMEVDYDKRKLEIIIVDGNSRDRTREIVQKYPVKLILEKRRGLNVARNTGIKNSHGKIIVFTDSDCVVPKDWIKKIVKNFRDPEVGCVGGGTIRYKNDFFSKYADYSLMPVLRRFKKREVLDNVALLFRYPAGCNMAFRRDAVVKVNGFDEGIQHSFDEDEFVERLCKAGHKMTLDPEVIVRHQHRTTLRGLLKQTFKYGRGGGFLLKKRKARDKISQWVLLNVLLFTAWLILVASLTFLTFTSDAIFLIPLLFITVAPFLLLTLFYACKALKRKDYSMVTYPLIDLLRIFAFCFGEMSGLLS